MREFYAENKSFLDKIIFLLAFLLLAYIFIKHIFTYIAPFVLGWLISLLISPLVGFFQKRLKIGRGISTIFLIIIAILLLAVAFTAIGSKMALEARILSESLPEQIDDIRKIFSDLRIGFEKIMNFIPEDFAIGFDDVVTSIISIATNWLGDFAKNVSLGMVSRVPNTLIGTFLCMISAFFFTRDKSIIAETVLGALPEWLRKRVRTIQRGFVSAISAYIKSQLIIMSVISSICILGLTILGYPYAVIVGILISLLDALPLLGGSLVFWPWALLSLISGNIKYTIGLLIINFACFLSRQLLEPKVLGHQIGVHPILVLMSLYVGLKIFGVAGLILGPILLITSKLIVKTENLIEPED